MPSVHTSVIFPNARLDNQGIFIPLSDLAGSDIQNIASLKKAIDEKIFNALLEADPDARPTNLTFSRSASADGRNITYSFGYTLVPVAAATTLAPEPTPAPPTIAPQPPAKGLTANA